MCSKIRETLEFFSYVSSKNLPHSKRKGYSVHSTVTVLVVVVVVIVGVKGLLLRLLFNLLRKYWFRSPSPGRRSKEKGTRQNRRKIVSLFTFFPSRLAIADQTSSVRVLPEGLVKSEQWGPTPCKTHRPCVLPSVVESRSSPSRRTRSALGSTRVVSGTLRETLWMVRRPRVSLPHPHCGVVDKVLREHLKNPFDES